MVKLSHSVGEVEPVNQFANVATPAQIRSFIETSAKQPAERTRIKAAQ